MAVDGFCIVCDEPAHRESHFCSKRCERKHMRSVDGPVQCEDCDLTWETVAQARRHGFRNVDECSEGISYNYLGICPECRKKRGD